MIELFFVTCLSADPSQCRDRSLVYADEIGVMTCMIRSQSELAEWIERHPAERVREWKCRILGEDGRTA
ncbi:hypothetical protein [Paracoccus spongiarum]|uniref:Transposase n=1 Tax=Paracoccus spongiarum TaxID=3064387 RepID=A0ABT9JCV2_9RHOB|nr:hypothetical protein [Paracoccus sp. 2205BS29-5]MDP5307638.1 hypothetical protein [Paracoccus sp. 2205BS29-5]